jgi:5-bromo-4-chloroindolyl phosphate hydrolysis protein
MKQPSVKDIFQQTQISKRDKASRIIDPRAPHKQPQIDLEQTILKLAQVVGSQNMIFDQLNVVNSINRIAQQICQQILCLHSSSSAEPKWYDSEEAFISLIDKYFGLTKKAMAIPEDEPTQIKINDCIKKFVTLSCLYHYGLYTEDVEYLKNNMQETDAALTEIIKTINNAAMNPTPAAATPATTETEKKTEVTEKSEAPAATDIKEKS